MPISKSFGQSVGHPPVVQSTMDEFFLRLSMELIERHQVQAALVPSDQRVVHELRDASGAVVAKKVVYRKPIKQEMPVLWLVIDFDDVISHTTTAIRRLHAHVASLGVSPSIVDELYDAAKERLPDGRTAFRPKKFLEGLSRRQKLTAAQLRTVTGLLNAVSVDQAVIRMLVAARTLVAPQKFRLTVLTAGDFDYQHLRVMAAGLAGMIDDAIFTEGSKRTALETELQEHYPLPTRVPLIVCVDDRPDNVDDYSGLAAEWNLINVRYIHPQAKYATSPHQSSAVVVTEETGLNEGAIALLRLMRLAYIESAHGQRTSILAAVQSTKFHQNVMGRYFSFPTERNIQYRRHEDRLVRLSDVTDDDGSIVPTHRELGWYTGKHLQLNRHQAQIVLEEFVRWGPSPIK